MLSVKGRTNKDGEYVPGLRDHLKEARMWEPGKEQKPDTPPSRRFHDGDGLYLRVTKRTSKTDGSIKVTASWFLRRRIAGKVSWLGLGKYRDEPDHLDHIRKVAREKRREIELGANPITEREQHIEARKVAKAAEARAKAEDVTFEQAAQKYFEHHGKRWSNVKHRAQFLSTLGEYVFPQFGAVRVADVSKAMVRQMLEQPLEKAKGESFWLARPETAQRVRSRVAQVLDFSKANDWRTGDNAAEWKGGLAMLMPTQELKPEDERHHRALPYRNLPTFLADLHKREGTAPRALEFLTQTLCRTSEVIGARWDEFNFPEMFWQVPASRMKMGLPHRVPLTRQSCSLLRSLRREKGTDLVFIGPQGGELSNGAMVALLKRMNYHHLATPHGMRSAFRDWVAERTAFPREIAERCLAHRIEGDVELAYLRSDLLEKRRQLLQVWTDFLYAPPAEGKNVSTMRKAS